MVGQQRGGLEDERAVQVAYAAHGAELFRFAFRQLDDRGLAEEAVQETFVRAWRGSRRFDPALGSLRTWLFAIARNVVIDLARARAVRPAMAADGDGSVVDLRDEDVVDRILLAWQVEEALRRLSGDHRQAVVETHYRGRPYRDVAAELGIPEGTLRSRVFYGLKALRLALEEMGWESDG